MTGCKDAQLKQWTTFKGTMLDYLKPGKYYLRQKTCVTAYVAGIEECPLADQLLYEKVDLMERSILDSAIETKIRELNRGGNVRILLSIKITLEKDGRQETSAGRSLIIFENDFGDKKFRKGVKDLGELLEMAYDQILVQVSELPENELSDVRMDQAKSGCAPLLSFRDHNYCAS